MANVSYSATSLDAKTTLVSWGAWGVTIVNPGDQLQPYPGYNIDIMSCTAGFNTGSGPFELDVNIFTVSNNAYFAANSIYPDSDPRNGTFSVVDMKTLKDNAYNLVAPVVPSTGFGGNPHGCVLYMIVRAAY